MKNISFLLLITILLLSSCREDESLTEYEFDPIDNGITISTSFFGQIIDENGLPITDALVLLGDAEQLSNEDGYFGFQEIEIKENGQMLEVQKEGFFKIIKRVIPTTKTTFQRIGLISKDGPTGTFSSTESTTVSKNNAERITFEANSMVDEFGEDYNGMVRVYTHHYNPENLFLGETVPGDFSAISDEGKRAALSSYSLLLVELYGEDNQKLNIKSGNHATVEFPIKGIDQEAPSSTILWSLDEQTGVWIEEGTASKEENYYKTTVSHFSFWNCANYSDNVWVNGQIIIEPGIPLEGFTLLFESLDGAVSGCAFINSEGEFKLYLPVDIEFTVSIFDNCGEIAHTQNIGPFSEDQEIDISISNPQLLTLSGTLLDCDGNPVNNGYVVAEFDSGVKNIISIDSNGYFESAILVCESNEVIVYGVDTEGIKKSSDIIIDYNDQANESLGNILVCEVPEEFISMNFLGNSYLVTETKRVIIFPNELLIEANYNPHGSPFFSFKLENPQLGTNIADRVHIGDIDAGINLGCNNANSFPSCNSDLVVEITKLDDFIGGVIEGSLDGQVWSESGATEDIQVQFSVIIDFKLIEISGRVWDDLNKDGIQDADEPGVPDVSLTSVVSINGTGSYGASTDGDGFFTTLSTLGEPAILRMFDIPDYVITLQGQGSDPTLDSDFSPLSGEAENIIAIEGALNRWDCGVYKE